MPKFEMELEIYATKYIVVEAVDEDNAMEVLEDILEKEIIPIKPNDYPEVNVLDVYSVEK